MNFITQWFLEPVQKQYTDFNGRATREQYWKFFLASLILSILVGIVGEILNFELLSTLFMLGIFLPSIAFGARRLHDTNKSGWWQLIAIIPFVGWIIVIVLLAQKGDVGSNKFGPALVATQGNPTPTHTEGSPTTTEKNKQE